MSEDKPSAGHIKTGDLVKYREPSDAEESAMRFIVREINGEGVGMSEVGDVDLIPVPVERVHVSAIEPA